MALFGRRLSLLVGAGGQGLDLAPNPSNLPKVKFQVWQGDKETPHHAQVRVYNLSEDTRRRIQGEFVDLVLQAGYVDGPFGIVFQGSIVQTKRGWEGEGGVDSYVDIIGADEAFASAIVNSAVAKGSSFQDRANALAKAASLPQGFAAQLPPNQLPRGRVYYGMVRDHLRDLTASTDTTWWVQNGQLQVMSKTGYLPGEAVVLTSKTGLIGWPRQTEQGIEIRCLLNPKIKPGVRVQIDNASVLQADLNLSISGAASNALLPSISDDGLYRVIVCEQRGDTRGNDWYCDLICIGLNQPITPSLVNRIIADGYS